MPDSPAILNQDFTLGFTYTRSVGPVVGRFLGELKNRKVVGIRASNGDVIMPPIEFDPATAEALSEFVPLGEAGVVRSWTWVSQPRPLHLFDEPFAWALIQLAGADVPFVHMVRAAGPEQINTGMQVTIHWADEPRGHITDIAWFDPA